MEFRSDKIYDFKLNKGDNFTSIIGSLDFSVRIGDKLLKIGRGSSGVLSCIRYFGSQHKAENLLEVGCYSEFSPSSRVILGGEHYNSLAFNGSWNSFPHIRAYKNLNNVSGSQVKISHNVTLSYDSLVLSGADIGAGAVIGAGALVSKSLEGKCIYAGVPAKRISYRFINDEENELWESINWGQLSVSDYLNLTYLLSNKQYDMATSYLKNVKEYDEKVVCFDGELKEDGEVVIKNLLGVSVQNRFVEATQLPEGFIKYLRQAIVPSAGSLKWAPDPFTIFGV